MTKEPFDSPTGLEAYAFAKVSGVFIRANPWLGALMDTGNFMEDPYDKLKMIAPKTVYVQAKTYFGGGEWYTLDLDYARIAGILADAGYTGYCSLEFEGKENADVAVPRSIELLRVTIGA